MKTINRKALFMCLVAVAISVTMSVWAADVEPSTSLTEYYASIDGKSSDNDDLRSTLSTITGTGFVNLGYTNLKKAVFAASSNPSDFVNGDDKTLEDIYSSKAYVVGDAGSAANDCGEGWNKEHTVPRSWFGGEVEPMNSDAFHIYPTDIHMNSDRSNYPYGENNAALDCETYGYGHLGASTFDGYTGKVFDPGDGGENGSYKGDIARGYFYMVTRYDTTNFTKKDGGSVMFTYSNKKAQLSDYAINLMLKWHRDDPVSEKELKRNNAIYAHQKNRNPFIDYPELVEYIWGNKKGQSVSLASLVYADQGEGGGGGGGKKEPLANLLALKNAAAGTYEVILTDAVVTYVKDNNIAYIQDAEAGLYLYNVETTLAVGDVINGTVKVTTTNYKNLIEASAFDYTDATLTTGGTVTPKEMTIAELLTADYKAYESVLVTIVGARVTAAFDNRNATIEQDGSSLTLHDQNKTATITASVGVGVEVTGWLSKYNDELQLQIWYQDQIVTNQHKVTWSVAGYETTELYEDGAALVLPPVPQVSADDKMFVGWTASDKESGFVPSDLFTEAGNRTVTEDVTYHAVFTTVNKNVTYEKATTEPTDWSGNYLIVYETGGKVYQGSPSPNIVMDVDINYGVIAHSSDVEKCEVIFAAVEGGYSLKMNDSALYNPGKYMVGKSGENSIKYETKASACTLSFESANDIRIVSNTSVFRYNNTNTGNCFKFYKSASFDKQQAIQLYKRKETIVYSDTTLNCDVVTYTITWLNADESQIDQTKVVAGFVPTHANVVKQADAQYTYTFAGWTPEIIAATEDATYKATFSQAVNHYDIKFYYKTQSHLETLEYGALIATTWEPTLTNTAEIKYSFNGWKNLADGATVTGDATYEADVTSSKRRYEITFVAMGHSYTTEPQLYGTPYSDILKEVMPRLKSKLEAAGYTVKSDLSSFENDEYIYTFRNWKEDDEVVDLSYMTVKRAAIYVASFTETKKAQGVENVESGAVRCRKVVENGVMYIIRDSKKYSAQGCLIE